MSTSSPKRRRSSIYVHRNRSVHVPDGHMAVGLVTGAHGLRGEVRVELHTDFPERFAAGVRVYLGEDLQPADIVQARPHQGQMLFVFADVNSREQAEELRGLWVFIPDDEAVGLEADTYFVHDIVGLTVVTDDGRTLGKVTDVVFTGANDVYVIAAKKADGSKKEILVPAIADVIRDVDLDAGMMTITPLPGLLDDEPVGPPAQDE